MHLTQKQWLLLIALIIASCGAWCVVLKVFLDASLELKIECAWWFFCGCLVAGIAAICHMIASDFGDIYFKSRIKSQDTATKMDQFEYIAKSIQDFGDQLRRCGDIKIEGEINPALIAMKNKITEVKQAAEKGIDRE